MDNLVSIIMPAYNAEKYIKSSIDSVLFQSYSNWELLVILDNCTDETEHIVNDIQKTCNKIKIFKTINNKSGAIGARNLGIKNARGRFIAFLDSDDMWKKDKLLIQISYMLEKNISFCYGNYDVLKENGDVKKFKAKKRVNYNGILESCCIGCLTAVYDSSSLGKIYMPELAFKREDFATWLYILKKIEFAYNCNSNIGVYRLIKGSVSSNKIKLIKYHWNVLRNIENLSFIKCLWYLFATIIHKIFKY